MGGHGAAAVDKDLLGHGHYRYGRWCIESSVNARIIKQFNGGSSSSCVKDTTDTITGVEVRGGAGTWPQRRVMTKKQVGFNSGAARCSDWGSHRAR